MLTLARVLALSTSLCACGVFSPSDADTGSEGASGDDSSGQGGDNSSEEGGDDSPALPDLPFCDPVSGWEAPWSGLEDEIAAIVNQRRSEGADCGSEGTFSAVGPLTMNPALRCAARVHSRQMVMMEFFDHVTPWGEEPWDRIEAAGYNYAAAGENIAAGNPTAAATMQQWMDSDGHCANIMSAEFTEIGVGYFPGGGLGHMWTQVFGRP